MNLIEAKKWQCSFRRLRTALFLVKINTHVTLAQFMPDVLSKLGY